MCQADSILRASAYDDIVHRCAYVCQIINKCYGPGIRGPRATIEAQSWVSIFDMAGQEKTLIAEGSVTTFFSWLLSSRAFALDLIVSRAFTISNICHDVRLRRMR